MKDNLHEEIREFLGECLEVYLSSERTLHKFKNDKIFNDCTEIDKMINSTQKMIVFYLKTLEEI